WLAYNLPGKSSHWPSWPWRSPPTAPRPGPSQVPSRVCSPTPTTVKPELPGSPPPGFGKPSTTATWPSSPDSKGFPQNPKTSPRWDAAAPIPPPSHWQPRSMPMLVKSTPTSTGFSPPTRAWSPRPAKSMKSPPKKCWNWQPPAPKFSTCARSNTPAVSESNSTFVRHSPTNKVPGLSPTTKTPSNYQKANPWNSQSSPVLHTTPPKPKSPSSASPTFQAKPPEFSRSSRIPTPIST